MSGNFRELNGEHCIIHIGWRLWRRRICRLIITTEIDEALLLQIISLYPSPRLPHHTKTLVRMRCLEVGSDIGTRRGKPALACEMGDDGPNADAKSAAKIDGRLVYSNRKASGICKRENSLRVEGLVGKRDGRREKLCGSTEGVGGLSRFGQCGVMKRACR